MPVHQQRLVPVEEAAAYSGLHHSTIWRYVNKGVLTKHRLGVKFVRVDLDELDALIPTQVAS